MSKLSLPLIASRCPPNETRIMVTGKLLTFFHTHSDQVLGCWVSRDQEENRKRLTLMDCGHPLLLPPSKVYLLKTAEVNEILRSAREATLVHDLGLEFITPTVSR